MGYAAHTAPLAHAVAAPAVAPVAYHAAPAPTCVTEDVILVTQVCTPPPKRSAPPRPSPPRRSSTRRSVLRSSTPCVTLPLPTLLLTTARGRLRPMLTLTLMLSTSPTDTLPPMLLPPSPPSPLLCLLPTLSPTPSLRP